MNNQPEHERRQAGRDDDSPPGRGVRKPYARPALVVYGSLRALTGLTGNDEFDGIVGTGDVS